MGVVKNLMIRIGADVRGVVGGMKTAYNSTRQATSQIRSATAGMKQSVKDSFSGSRMSIREYTETVSNLKTAHNTAAQNTERLQAKLEQLQSVYDSLKAATDGIDLSTSLTDQIRQAETSWHGFLNEAQKVKESLKKELSLDDSRADPEKIADLRHELQILRTAADEAELELRELKSVAAAIGTDNISHASTAGMEKLKTEIKNVQQELNISRIKTGELGQKLKSLEIPNLIKNELKSIGAAAAAAARAGLQEMVNRLTKLGGSALKGIATLPLMLLNIGRSAESGNTSLERMVRTIRNIGIVSLGLRSVSGIFRGVFGELQGIVSSFVSQNEELNATITNMKNQLGQALLPVINVLIAAMQKLMPLILTISNVISAIFTRLFGSIATTTYGISSSAKQATSAVKETTSTIKQATAAVEETQSAVDKLQLYGFDQINKVSENTAANANLGNIGDAGDLGVSETPSAVSGTGAFNPNSGFGTTPAWLNSVLEWIDKMKAAFSAGDWKGLGKIIGDGINNAINAINAVDIGEKVGTFVNNFFTTLNSALATIDFFNMGKKVGEIITNGFKAINWNTIGETIGRAITAIPSIIVGFIQNTDWKLVAVSLSNALVGVVKTVTEWLRSVEWTKVGEAIGTFISNINWIEVFSSLGTLMWEGFKAAIEMLCGFIKGLGPGMILAAVAGMVSAFALKVAGDSLFASLWVSLKGALWIPLKELLKGTISTIVGAIGGWPALIIAAAAAAVAALVLWMKNGGTDVVAGFLQGIKEGLANIGAWLRENVFIPFVESFKALFGIHSPSTVMHEHGVNVIKGFFNGILEALGNIGDWINANIVSPFLTWITSLFGISDQSSILTGLGRNLIAGLLGGMSETWNSIENFISTKISGLENRFSQGWQRIRTMTSSSWKDIVNAVAEQMRNMQISATQEIGIIRELLAQNWNNILADCSNYVSQMAQNVKTWFQTIRMDSVNTFNGLRSDVQRIWSSINAQLGNSLNAMFMQFQTIYTQLRMYTESSWMSIQKAIETRTSSMISALEGFRQKLSTIFTELNVTVSNTMNKMIANIGNGFSNMLSMVHNAVGSVMMSISNMVNSAINGISRVGDLLSGANLTQPGSGGSGTHYATNPINGIRYPSLHLATGGITNGPTYALIGEDGKEAVMPLERNTGWMDALAGRIAAVSGSGNGTPVVLKFYIGGKKISQHVIKDINSITQTTGVCPINV